MGFCHHFYLIFILTTFFKFSAENESGAFRGDPTTRSSGFGKQLKSFGENGNGESLAARAGSKEPDGAVSD